MATTSLSRRDEEALVRTDEVRRWGTWLHLAVFANLLLPVLGTFAPIVLWLMKKEEAPGLQVHARNYIDGMLSYALYGVGLAVLGGVASIVPFLGGLVGLALLIPAGVLAFLGVASPVLAALKARKGEAMRYPLALPLLDSLAGEE